MPRVNIVLVGIASGIKADDMRAEIRAALSTGEPVVVQCRDPQSVQLLTVDAADLVAEQVSDAEAIIHIELVSQGESCAKP